MNTTQPFEAVTCDDGFVAGYNIPLRRRSEFEGGKLWLWRLESSSSIQIYELKAESAILETSLDGERITGLCMRAKKQLDESSICIIIGWSRVQLFQLELLVSENCPVHVISSTESATTEESKGIVMDESGARSCSIEGRKLIFRGGQLRRKMVVVPPEGETSAITAMSFCSYNSDEIVYSLESGVVYSWSLERNRANFRFEFSRCADVCLVHSFLSLNPASSSAMSTHFVVATRDGKLRFMERINDTYTNSEYGSAAVPICRERGVIDLDKSVRGMVQQAAPIPTDYSSFRLPSSSTTLSSSPEAKMRKATGSIPLSICSLFPSPTPASVQVTTPRTGPAPMVRPPGSVDLPDVLCVAATGWIVLIELQGLKVLKVTSTESFGVSTAVNACVSVMRRPVEDASEPEDLLGDLSRMSGLGSPGGATWVSGQSYDSSGSVSKQRKAIKAQSQTLYFQASVLTAFTKQVTVITDGVGVVVQQRIPPKAMHPSSVARRVDGEGSKTSFAPGISRTVSVACEDESESGIPLSRIQASQYHHDESIEVHLFMKDVTLVNGSPLLIELSKDGTVIRKKVEDETLEIATPRGARATPSRQASAGASAGGSVKGSSRTSAGAKKSSVVDKPITFNSRIKSSGYGQEPSTPLERMAKERERRLKASAEQRVLARSSSAPLGAVASRFRMYPVDCGVMSLHQRHNDYPPPASSTRPAITQMCYSQDSTMLGLATADNIVTALRLPVNKHNGDEYNYRGHNGRITSVCFSHDSKLMLSASVDGTARIWRRGQIDAAAVVISHTKHHIGCLAAEPYAAASVSTNPAAAAVATTISSGIIRSNGIKYREPNSSSNSQSRNKPFATEITSASFFFQDKYAAIVSKSTVGLYAYATDSELKRDDIAKLKVNNGKYYRAHQWKLSAQSVTAMSCINSVQSPLLFCATSDRKIYILDAATGTIARGMDSVHDRAIHCIALPQPSVHAPMASHCYNLFATAAADNVVALWDLRSPVCAARYTGHQNRREAVQCSISPCLRYFAVGSEDMSARVVDITAAKEVARLQHHHRDVVSATSFNPLFPQLATASFDGTVRFFVDPDAVDSQF